jgi:hypothetical protein
MLGRRSECVLRDYFLSFGCHGYLLAGAANGSVCNHGHLIVLNGSADSLAGPGLASVSFTAISLVRCDTRLIGDVSQSNERPLVMIERLGALKPGRAECCRMEVSFAQTRLELMRDFTRTPLGGSFEAILLSCGRSTTR